MNVSDLCLRIVPLRNVIVHEYIDPRRVNRLVERLRVDRLLKNPPVVAGVEGQYIVLDGATRVSAMKSLGLRDVLVQVVDYSPPAVVVDTWHHVVVGLSQESFMAELDAMEELAFEDTDQHSAAETLALRKASCYLVFRDGQTWVLKDQGGLETQVKLLGRLVDIYRGRAEVYRVISSQLDEALHEYPNLTALVVFPRFFPSEIVRLAVNGVKLPMGISRHVISGRTLGLNVNFELLEADGSLEEKNAWLQGMLQERVRSRKVRYYQEPVFIFDE